MIRINQLSLPLEYTPQTLQKKICRLLKIDSSQIRELRLLRRSVDARKKDQIRFIASVGVSVHGNEQAILHRSGCKTACLFDEVPYSFPACSVKSVTSPVVVGAGPAGLFCAYILAKCGLEPLVIERGQPMEQRLEDVRHFFDGGELLPESNVQFGEGGAGTFSDGKLQTGIKDPRIRLVLQVFAECGAPADILWQQKPHIGTDKLRDVVVTLRKTIQRLGGRFTFNCRLEEMHLHNRRLCAITVMQNGAARQISCDRLVLAIGHSARDTFSMLYQGGLSMVSKPFAVGVRIEHPQTFINHAQYGSHFYNHPALPAADYKLAVHLPNSRGVYTFCMCPGGRVVAAASEPGGIVTNGMSNYARDTQNANSAVLVNVTPADFPSEHPLAGIAFQRTIEQAAFAAAGHTYRAPAQTFGAFCGNHAAGSDHNPPPVTPSYQPGVTFCDLHTVLPDFICNALQQGIIQMDRYLHGFASDNALLTAPETRSSSPVRLLRDEHGCSSIQGIYPCGEGAGYAGGITSAAVDGIRCAEQLIDTFTE